MTRDQIEAVNRERLTEWLAALARHHATALVLVGIGHDHEEGTWRVLVPEGLLTTEELVGGLVHTARMIAEGDAEDGGPGRIR